MVSKYPSLLARRRAKYQRRKSRDPEGLARKSINYQFKRNYGITLEQRDAMIVDQDHKCSICKTLLVTSGYKGSRTVNIDHDHRTGRVRSVLCANCNKGLGMFKDSSAVLVQAAAYLDKHAQIIDL